MVDFFGLCADTLSLTVMGKLVLNETQAAVCWAELCLTLQLTSCMYLIPYSISLGVKIHVGHKVCDKEREKKQKTGEFPSS